MNEVAVAASLVGRRFTFFGALCEVSAFTWTHDESGELWVNCPRIDGSEGMPMPVSLAHTCVLGYEDPYQPGQRR